MDHNARVLQSMVRLHGGGQWDVLHACDTPSDLPVCTRYGGLSPALAALAVAGFEATRLATPAPGLDGPYDHTTCMRFRSHCGHGVVLVKLRQPEKPEC